MKVLIIGAGGQISRQVIRELLERTDAHLTLFARAATPLPVEGGDRVDIVRGDALDPQAVQAAVQGQDLVYVNLSGPLEAAAQVVVEAMQADQARRIVFVSSMGIYDEIPGQHHGAVLDPYRRSAAVVEALGSITPSFALPGSTTTRRSPTPSPTATSPSPTHPRPCRAAASPTSSSGSFRTRPWGRATASESTTHEDDGACTAEQ